MQKHSLIIGGTRGIGRELARMFSEEQHKVSVIGKRAPSAEDAALKRVKYWAVDLADHAALDATLREIITDGGKINNLVFLQRFKGEGDKWVGEVETSLSATRKVIESLADQFTESTDNSIVVVSSIADQFIAEGQPVGYHVSKAGLFQMVCFYAVTLGAKGIRVNCVSPGTVVKQENRDFYSKNADLQDLFKRTVPLGRMGTALESANVIAFLCSPKASFVTGQKIVVDGGVSLVSQESLARKLTGK